MWNSLPKVMVTAPSMKAFENGLDAHWSQLTVKYDFDIAYEPDPATRGINMKVSLG